MLLLCFLFLSWIFYLFMEARQNEKALSSFRAVIHVNGIRGKTSTCRAIDAALRTKYRVFTKTTGTDAAYIDVSGLEHPVRRFGPANIHEQLHTIRRAQREGAEILILECMAVNPELQKTSQEQIVRSGISVITNVRFDHVFEMGETKEEIAAALSAVIPERGLLFTADPQGETYFGEACRIKGTELVLLSPGPEEAGTAEENALIARAVSGRLGVTEEEFLKSRKKVREDFGIRKLYPVKTGTGKNCLFLNLFSANDPESTRSNLEAVKRELETSRGIREELAQVPLVFLYNHRTDRADRALLFARHFFPAYPEVPVFLSGSGSSLPRRLFNSSGSGPVKMLSKRAAVQLDLPDIPAGALIVGLGNIKGPAYRLIERLETEESNQERGTKNE